LEERVGKAWGVKPGSAGEVEALDVEVLEKMKSSLDQTHPDALASRNA
jgi:hypothetical protein